MHYLIYLPKLAEGAHNKLDLPTRLREAGLADHVDGATPVNIHEGPDGGAGFVIGWGNTANRLQYKPTEQTWLKAVPHDDLPAGRYYAGLWNDAPPQEGELRRAYTQPGKFVQLGDDRWKLPTPDTVDKYAAYNDDGSMRWETVRAFSWLVDEAAKMHDEYLESGSDKLMRFALEPSEFVGWVLKLLRVNYRITPEVAAHLELWRIAALRDAVLASLGLRVVEGDDG